MDLVLRQHFPTREPTTAEREQRGSKRPSEQDRMARLQKLAKIGDGGKVKAGISASAPTSRAGPTAAVTRTPFDPPDARVSRSKDKRPVTVVSFSWSRNTEKKATDKAKEIGEKLKDAEKRASEAEGARKEAEDTRRKAENDLAAAHSEHSKYLQVALPAAFDEARRQAVKDYLQSDDFNSRLFST
ncbi:hypothetical protein TIFTF001_044472 [Ficus carica]|uniref:Uncharacterized protein n=1 Tax=Ficus carica TaxID=3494 RepID=A0AA87ZPH8_FICCA|nr:hypothetical protein TIFTF001_044455 [Ficus carica]GMN30340.1 hypothetical protein TIFTF001_044459 [Ficus carica]GMN30361.1 hypothetical protein TIFTF001_044468 [Ficus carica]GMN30391.1 hypothetical protein TIFTF001_044472 [Ficus carica]